MPFITTYFMQNTDFKLLNHTRTTTYFVLNCLSIQDTVPRLLLLTSVYKINLNNAYTTDTAIHHNWTMIRGGGNTVHVVFKYMF